MMTAPIVDLVAQAGLAGRGGAAFDTATKLAAARDNRAMLIVNVCDGEPGAAKDGWIVQRHLHELIEGARLIAGDQPVRFAAHRGSATEVALRSAGLDVVSAPARYVSSEESSLVSLAHGGLARPMTKRAPFVFGGRDGAGRRIQPTLVLNAETVWRIAQIAEHGPAWFRSFGTPQDPGPRLVTLTGHLARPGVLETEAGVSLAELLEAGGAADADAIVIGGLAGVFVTDAQARTLTWTTESLSSCGAGLGAGLIEVVDPARCPLDDVRQRLAYAAGESAGQCGPCMFGLPSLATAWQTMCEHPTPAAIDQLRTRLGLLVGRGACHFPDGIARFVDSALRVHSGHLESHLAHGPCGQHADRSKGARHAVA